jgi:hypothetical protein
LFQQPDIDPSNPEQQDAALKIQTQYRKHRATEDVQQLREDQAATKIQAYLRGCRDRQRVKEMRYVSTVRAVNGTAALSLQGSGRNVHH